MKETIKSWFRRVYGYDEKNRCGDCLHCVRNVRNRNYYKCAKMGITASASTDIKLKDKACELFSPNIDEVKQK